MKNPLKRQPKVKVDESQQKTTGTSSYTYVSGRKGKKVNGKTKEG